MVTIRPLTKADFAKLPELDLSEHITQSYRVVDGELQLAAQEWHRPRGGDETHWQQQIALWQQELHPDVWLVAFANDSVAGLAALRDRLAPELAQLTELYVSLPFRRQGVARQLLHRVVELAQQSGATTLYVSATPSASAVGFYLSQGFQLAAEPNPLMFALEPDDIHLVLSLHRDQ